MKSEPASASRHRTCSAVGSPDPGTWSVTKRFPRAPVAHSLRVGFFLSQIVRLAELLIPLILSLGANVDLHLSRVRIDVIGLPVTMDGRHFIGCERLEVLLLLGSGGHFDSEARGREQALFLGCGARQRARPCSSTACREDEKRESAYKAEGGE